MKKTITAIVLSTLTAGSIGLAGSPSTNCIDKKEADVAWKSVDKFKEDLLAKEPGMTIKKVKKLAKYGCYEVYGKDKDGKGFECFYNPETGEKKSCDEE